jgi:hypothetical protein
MNNLSLAVERFDAQDVLDDLAWCDCMEEDLSPCEDDYVTSDHVHWYQYGKLVLTTPIDEDYRPIVKRHMDRNRFWPCAWFVSDHGNYIPLDLEAD